MWASLIAQLVKNPPAMQETPVRLARSGRSADDGIGYPVQCSPASLVAQLVKNPPAMRESWVWSLGWEDPLEKGKATHSSVLAWRIPWTVWSMGSQIVGHTEWLSLSLDVYSSHVLLLWNFHTFCFTLCYQTCGQFITYLLIHSFIYSTSGNQMLSMSQRNHQYHCYHNDNNEIKHRTKSLGINVK